MVFLVIPKPSDHRHSQRLFLSKCCSWEAFWIRLSVLKHGPSCRSAAVCDQRHQGGDNDASGGLFSASHQHDWHSGAPHPGDTWWESHALLSFNLVEAECVGVRNDLLPLLLFGNVFIKPSQDCSEGTRDGWHEQKFISWYFSASVFDTNWIKYSVCVSATHLISNPLLFKD